MTILSNANDILIDFTGKLSYLTDDIMYYYNTADVTTVAGQILSGNSDMSEPSADKLINFVDVDYVGAFSLTFYLDGVVIHTMDFPTLATRSTAWKDYPLNRRRSFQKLQIGITSATKGTKIYGIEIDFSALKRRRNG